MIPIQTLKQFAASDRYDRIMTRSRSRNDDLLPTVQAIMQDVQMNGDDALRRYTKQFDGADLVTMQVAVCDIKSAYAHVSENFITALNLAVNNIRTVHQDQMPKFAKAITEPMSGIRVWRRWQPIETIGVYVPGGKAAYPSSVLMNVIPAQIAGCKRIIMVTPPQTDGSRGAGSVSPFVLVAADVLGINEIYSIGGAQAIAALAYGTESVVKVDKIVGPGNAYVTAAKLLAFSNGDVAIDSPAGPSEVLVLADETANPQFVAADLICDTEHGNDSAGVLVTTSRQLAEQVACQLTKLTANLSTADRVIASMKTYGALIVVETLDEAIVFANTYAAEHTLIQTRAARQVADRITNAGSVFIGPYSCKSAGDYATGSNHVLPTGGGARMFSALSVYDFLKLVEYQEVSLDGLTAIRGAIEELAGAEGLPGHAQSCAVRFTRTYLKKSLKEINKI